MEKFMTTLNDYLIQAGSLVKSYAPQAWEATLRLTQITSIIYLVFGFVAAIGLVICVKQLVLGIQQATIWDDLNYSERSGSGAAPPGLFVPRIVIAVVAGITCVATALSNLFSMVIWLGAFAPDLAIIYRVAVKAGLM